LNIGKTSWLLQVKRCARHLLRTPITRGIYQNCKHNESLLLCRVGFFSKSSGCSSSCNDAQLHAPKKNWPQFRSQPRPIPNRYPFFSSRFSLLPRPNLQFSALTFSRVFYQSVYTVSVESRRWWSRNVLNIKDLHLGIFEALATQLGSTGQWRPIEISLVSTSFTPWRNISTNRFGCCFYFLEATRPALRAAARPPLSKRNP
ncbi:hypothetical protein B0H14DRAFT_2660610, partial [Mycena olivaceomarginata]